MHQTTFKIYDLNQASEYMTQKIKTTIQIHNCTGDFNIPFSTINVSIKQKINKI